MTLNNIQGHKQSIISLYYEIQEFLQRNKTKSKSNKTGRKPGVR